MLEKELGRVRESYNSMGDSMYGVFAGIVDAEAKRNPDLKYDGSWWDTYKHFLVTFEFQGIHAWPNSIDNVYDTCDDSSPHPYCKSTASSNWTDNFRNFPLQQVVRQEFRHHFSSRERQCSALSLHVVSSSPPGISIMDHVRQLLRAPHA
jgi:hypothetical protein